MFDETLLGLIREGAQIARDLDRTHENGAEDGAAEAELRRRAAAVLEATSRHSPSEVADAIRDLALDGGSNMLGLLLFSETVRRAAYPA